MRSRRTEILCLLIALLLTTAGIARAQSQPPSQPADWPGWRGPNRDGKSLDRRLLTEWPEEGPRLLWKLDNIGKGYSSVAVTGGTIYTTGTIDGKTLIFALDLDGKLRWKTELDSASSKGPNIARSTPTIDGGDLYVLSGDGLAACHDAKTGTRKWSRSAAEFGGRSGGWGYAESVLIYKDLAVIKPGGANCIAALDKSTGETVWTSTGFKAGPEYGSCIVVDYEGRTLICTGTRGGLVGVDARDGKLLWSNDFSAGNTANCPTPVAADGYVFWANGYGKGGVCMRLKIDGGKVSADEAWTTSDMNCHHGGFIIHQGCIYGNHGGGWACLDLKTGQRKWQERGVGKGSLCFADGMLYLFGQSGGKAGLATCSPESMQMAGTFSVEGDGPSWAHPAVANGRLYLRYDRNLYCFDIRQ